ncbi:transcription initiation factor [Favolaschia claudopus]|uniref:Transcription initiation factor n=1 Tax=Favolaschia claudopus TaxID=2862362 RepID=A0AAW0E8C9_9AGAR
MAGRKKASAAKSTGKQQTLFDLFKKPAPISEPPFVSQNTLPLTAPINDEQEMTVLAPPPSQTLGSLSWSSQPPEIIDISSSSPTPVPPLAPPPNGGKPMKFIFSRQWQEPFTSGPSRPLDPVVIDLTVPSDASPLPLPSKTPKATYSIFAPRTRAPAAAIPATSAAKPPRQTYSVFNTRSEKPSGQPKLSHSIKECDAPFPAEDTQHIHRWRPQRADGVLGNEANTVYLRDWMQAHEVQFETPNGLNGVSDASDYSSDAEGFVATEGEDDDDFLPASTEEARYGNAFSAHLANTIILSGPSGSGKTTAVYSCAEELGWEVFEVYPGIGKRNGASLESLIGEEADSDNSTDFGFMSAKAKAGTRQSVILLEEVDILFKEDANFWPAVIRLIRDSKRAVICTCNDADISLIPIADLPLQTILYFQPCPSEIAGSYLQGLCCAEGHIVDRNVLAKMYAKGGFDLRHTILRLQLLCQDFPLGTRPELDHLLDWNVAPRQSIPHADLISFMDAYMTRGSLDRPEALASTQHVSSTDEELGHPILRDAVTDGYGTYELDTKFICAVMEVSRGKRVARAEFVGEDYQELIDALRNNSAFPVGVMDRVVAHTDYVPLARQIIAEEDALEARVEHGGRATRSRGRYIRSIEIEERERERLKGSAPLSQSAWLPIIHRLLAIPLLLLVPWLLWNTSKISVILVQHRHTSLVPQHMPQTTLISASSCVPPHPTIHMTTNRVRLRASVSTPFAIQVRSHKIEGDDPMNVDDDAPPRPLPRSARHMSHEPQGPQFDYTMRRHSIAVGHTRSPSRLSAPHGVKRKMSADPAGFPTVGEEGDPPLSGPGVPSGMALDPQAPAPKRRGSAIDTQRIAQLSLNDRRDSHDGRAHQWWANDRRDSTASAFSNASTVGGDYSPGHSGGDSPHGRQPPGIATFAWPSSHPAGPDQPGTHNEVEGVSATPRTLDPAVSVARMPPTNFPPDRRMSVPDVSAIGPTRSLRSRSRPPSRSKQSPEANHSGPSSAQDDPVSAPSPTASSKHFKESSSTAPYSRSPELRVSHKLAERKRRKEMKELFDELRDQLPADRGMKASKWEILSKAIEFVHQLKQGHQEMAREIEVLRHEVETLRPGSYPPGSTHPPGHFQPPSSSQQTLMTSRPTSQNSYPPSAGGTTGHNGSLHRTDGPPS